ncbi:NAD-binding protein [Sanghuangporus baumii]|uniref:NAD-binding protein n=1 Tax=Sanghuangporus baumii TaxID=108892 RepID=A0A9Q5HRR6_SANBA|nr:NAD-binding protein [Sanghuangporus baumii]
MVALFSQDSSAPAVPFSNYTPRVAIVTGAAQGIGYAIAQKLADDGIDVAVNDIISKQTQIGSVVEELRKKGRHAIAIPGDVSNEQEVISMIEKTMVANAGIAAIGAFLETSGETFDRIYSVNVRGVFFCFKQAALQMIKQGRGGRLIGLLLAILLVLCIEFAAIKLQARTQNLTAYSAAKFAVRGLTQTASIELRRHGITANSYAPGYIRTPLGATSDGVDDNCATVRKLFGAPDAPVAEADTVASIVSYLVKPEAYFINGQCISVDGGLRYD